METFGHLAAYLETVIKLNSKEYPSNVAFPDKVGVIGRISTEKVVCLLIFKLTNCQSRDGQCLKFFQSRQTFKDLSLIYSEAFLAARSTVSFHFKGRSRYGKIRRIRLCSKLNTNKWLQKLGFGTGFKISGTQWGFFDEVGQKGREWYQSEGKPSKKG